MKWERIKTKERKRRIIDIKTWRLREWNGLETHVILAGKNEYKRSEMKERSISPEK